MIDSIVPFITTTVALIFACILGVSGVADGVHFNNGVMVVEQWEGWGVAFGGMAFANKYNESHETGHVYQARELGFMFLPIVGIPSLISVILTPEQHSTRWFERQATELGRQAGENEFRD